MDWAKIEHPTGFIGAGRLMQQLAKERRERNDPPVPPFSRRPVVVKKKGKKS